jgi:hypothetical protein
MEKFTQLANLLIFHLEKWKIMINNFQFTKWTILFQPGFTSILQPACNMEKDNQLLKKQKKEQKNMFL